MKRRKYTLISRAERQEETRLRIVEAAMALHEEVGPKHTTVSGIAARAGVQRLTVYRHFPDEGSLLTACSGRWLEHNPPPDLRPWQAISEPGARARAALTALYRYYRNTERMWRRAYRDREEMPALQGVMAGFEDYLAALATVLLGRAMASPPSREGVTVVHCLRFSTWQSLKREGLGDIEMAELAMGWIASAQAGKKRNQIGA